MNNKQASLDSKVMVNAEAAKHVNWLNLPRAIALALFSMADALLEIAEELKRKRDDRQ